MTRRVVVTGLGCVTSLACQVDELFKRLLNGESGIHPLRIIDTERFKVKFGGDVYDWEPERWPAAFVEKPDSFTEKKEIKRLDRFSQFAMVAGHEAVARTARAAFPAAEKGGDESTADLLTQRLQVHEKTAWMLRSLLK